jgi:two-component system nitrate/nitrite response regulator NarL
MTTEATNDSTRKNILICDTQPVAVEGMKWLIENTGDLRFAGSVPTLEAVYNLLYPQAAPVIEEPVIDEQAALEPELAGIAEIAVLTGIDTGDDAPAPEAPEALEAAETVLEATADLPLEASLEAALEAELPLPEHLDAIVIDKGLGFSGVMDLLQRLTANSHPTPVVVWGAAVSEAEALRLLQAGARGILRRTSESGTLLTCLRAVTTGGTWMEDGIFGSTEKLFNPKRSQLTNRESQVVVLVEKGLRNRDIARQLGIQTGTVKIHLKHIFEKTGVRGRYGLAFTGLQNKGSISPNAPIAPPHFTA